MKKSFFIIFLIGLLHQQSDAQILATDGLKGRTTGDESGPGYISIWGISDEYPATDWGFVWDGDPNQFKFIGNGTERLTIDMNDGQFTTTGNIGIGTTIPNYPLHIKSAGYGSHLTIETSATGQGDLRWFQGGTGTANQRAALQVDESTGDFEGWVNNNINWIQWLQVDRTNGKVAIGSSDVESTLTVGNSNHAPGLIVTPKSSGSNDPYIELHGESSITNEGFRITYDNSIGDTYFNNIYQNSISAFHFQSSGNELMTLLSNGAVGIGTSTTGSHKLAVEGSIGAREIKVEANGWSDLVFEDDYELPTLEEVEQYIDENGHLPEIPSETEVTENGINLGEMDAKLLQKIEELTLYMIDMNKQLKSQNERMEQLEQENSKLKQEVSALKN